MAVVREINAKSLLTRSGISDYCVNCYTGCLHSCIYCYARFMKEYCEHYEAWGQFLDVKVNAPDVLVHEVRRRSPASVVMSSVCDGWQPAERKYQLSRRCLAILLEAGFQVRVLTKSSLIVRDFDIMRQYQNVALTMTVTTFDETIRRGIEPAASASSERLRALCKAAEAGIRISVFIGPLMPGLTDTKESLEALFAKISSLPIDSAYLDKLNPRRGVWNSVVQYLHRRHPELIGFTRAVLFDEQRKQTYAADLRDRAFCIAKTCGMEDKLTVVC